MNIVQRLGSYFSPAPRQDGAAENQEGRRSSACHQFTRIASGIGLASLAVLSAIGNSVGRLSYAGRYIANRVNQRNVRAAGAGAGAMEHEDEAIERIERIAPIEHGHEAHGHRQEVDPEEIRAALRRLDALEGREADQDVQAALRRLDASEGRQADPDVQSALRRMDLEEARRAQPQAAIPVAPVAQPRQARVVPIHELPRRAAPVAPRPVVEAVVPDVPRHVEEEEPVAVIRPRPNERSMLSNLWTMGSETILNSAAMHPLKKVYKMSALIFAIFMKMISNLFTGIDRGDMHSQVPSTLQYSLGKCFGGLIAFLSIFLIAPTVYYIYRLVK